MALDDLVQLPLQGGSSAASAVMEVYDPTGAMEIIEIHARRLDTLNGKTVCELSNDAWQAHRVFPEIRRLLRERFPTVKFIPYTEFPTGYERIDTAKTAALVARAKPDAVIIGNAS